MKKQKIIGFLVLDEGEPVRLYPESKPRWRYHHYLNSRYGVALFPSRKIALRVKRLLFEKYSSIATGFNPAENAGEKRCFDLWLKRAHDLRITCVVQDAPTVADLREVQHG